LDFRIDSYKLRIDYLTKQFDRMWQRFQLLLGIDTALVALIFAPFSQKRFGTVVFAVVGVLASLFWFFVGAADRCLVELYREQLRHECTDGAWLVTVSDFGIAGGSDTLT